MRQFIPTVLASLASLAVIGTAEAQSYTGFTATAGTITTIPAATDIASPTDLSTLFLKLYDTGGAVIPGTFAVFAGYVEAVYTSGGAVTTIRMTPMSPTQTKVSIKQSTPAAGKGMRRIEFGTVNSRAGFDIVNATVRTPGSGLGFAPAASALLGPGVWSANIQFLNAVALSGAAPQNDLYKTMAVNFGTPIFNGQFDFVVDTDRLY